MLVPMGIVMGIVMFAYGNWQLPAFFAQAPAGTSAPSTSSGRAGSADEDSTSEDSDDPIVWRSPDGLTTRTASGVMNQRILPQAYVQSAAELRPPYVTAPSEPAVETEEPTAEDLADWAASQRRADDEFGRMNFPWWDHPAWGSDDVADLQAWGYESATEDAFFELRDRSRASRRRAEEEGVTS